MCQMLFHLTTLLRDPEEGTYQPLTMRNWPRCTYQTTHEQTGGSRRNPE